MKSEYKGNPAQEGIDAVREENRAFNERVAQVKARLKDIEAAAISRIEMAVNDGDIASLGSTDELINISHEFVINMEE